MERRFIEDELKEWTSFDFHAVAPQSQLDFGNENVQRLVEKYQKVLVLGDCDTPDDVVQQYKDYKYVVAEHVKERIIHPWGSIECTLAHLEFVPAEVSLMLGCSYIPVLSRTVSVLDRSEEDDTGGDSQEVPLHTVECGYLRDLKPLRQRINERVWRGW
ncbi:hypothetical protein NDU88_005507 [Pleurodeles waltl]|uniref:Uncharacterized protein n=1 Tax=Pleurodeles waltl TaxID=8319 RepID=A0AAV7LLH7_PLEWA|nr:hypothetical protein NDU88_005507 [Pleurodeles waltl]